MGRALKKLHGGVAPAFAAFASSLAIGMAVAAGSNCADPAALDSNTPLANICQSFSSAPNSGLSFSQAAMKESSNAGLVAAAADKYGVDQNLALAVAYQESKLSSCAGSPTGVKGVMQLTQSTGSAYGYNRDINEQNVQGGMATLQYSINKCGTSDYACLAKYYNGSNPAQQAQWAKGVQQAYDDIQNQTGGENYACTAATGTSCAPQSEGTGDKAGYQKYLGSYQGVNQECASLVKALTPGLGAASTWQKGDQVLGDNTLPIGTAVATFNGSGGTYGTAGSPGGASGFSHTGLYMGQDSGGVYLLDQYNGSGGAAIRYYATGAGLESGARYHTIAR